MKKNLVKAGLASAMSLAAVVAPAAEGLWFDNATAEDKAYAFGDAQVKVDENGYSVEDAEYYAAVDTDSTKSTQVYAVIASDFQVVVPKTIILAGKKGEDSTARYLVDVDGDFAGDESVEVYPDKDGAFKMSQLGKADKDAQATQEITKFYSDLYTGAVEAGATKLNDRDLKDDVANDDVEAEGNIAALLTAGQWQGTFDFVIKFNGSQNLIDGDDFLSDANADKIFDEPAPAPVVEEEAPEPPATPVEPEG